MSFIIRYKENNKIYEIHFNWFGTLTLFELINNNNKTRIIEQFRINDKTIEEVSGKIRNLATYTNNIKVIK